MRFLFRIGNRVIFSRRRKQVRKGLLFFIYHAFIAAGMIFILEVALIFMGINNMYLPLTGSAHDFLGTLIF
jgi:hypothetical protein